MGRGGKGTGVVFRKSWGSFLQSGGQRPLKGVGRARREDLEVDVRTDWLLNPSECMDRL